VSADQAMQLHDRIGNPFSFPANALFAATNSVSLAAYDLLEPNALLTDPDRPSGRIDFGGLSDRFFVGAGFYDRDRDGRTTYRATAARAELLVPLARRAALRLQLRLRALSDAGGPGQRLVVRINGAAFGPIDVGPDWATVEFATPIGVWRTTVNRVVFEFERTGPSAGTQRLVAAAIDYLNIEEPPK
jgi:hypothetical protein